MVTLLLVAKVTSQTNGYYTSITNKLVLTTCFSETTQLFTAVTTNKFGTIGFFNQAGTTRLLIRNTSITTNPFFGTFLFNNVVYSGKVLVQLLVLITCQIRKGSSYKLQLYRIAITKIQFALDQDTYDKVSIIPLCRIDCCVV